MHRDLKLENLLLASPDEITKVGMRHGPANHVQSPLQRMFAAHSCRLQVVRSMCAVA